MKEHIAAERVLFLSPVVVILPVGDVVALATSVDLWPLRDKGIRVPSDLLGSRLIPGTTLAWDSLATQDASLHRLLLEHAVNSGRIVLEFLAVRRRGLECLDHTWLIRVHVVRLLGNELN